MTPDKSTLFAREMGRCPDRIWRQLNGKSAQENFAEIMNERSRKSREMIMDRYKAKHQKEEDDEPINLVIESKVKK